MRKKNQNFSVDLVEQDQQLQVLVDGYIEKSARGFNGVFGKQTVINQAKSQDQALQEILASYNLYA